MVVAKKVEAVEELKEKFAKSQMAVLTDYRGLTVSDLTTLRSQLRAIGVDYRVTKNTLARFAAEQAGIAELAPSLNGPTAIAFSGPDLAKTAKTLNDFARTSKLLKIKGGVLQGKVVGPAQIAQVAELPSREVLLAKMVGGMQAPLVGLVSVLNGPLQGFVRVLQARQQQLEAGS